MDLKKAVETCFGECHTRHYSRPIGSERYALHGHGINSTVIVADNYVDVRFKAELSGLVDDALQELQKVKTQAGNFAAFGYKPFFVVDENKTKDVVFDLRIPDQRNLERMLYCIVDASGKPRQKKVYMHCPVQGPGAKALDHVRKAVFPNTVQGDVTQEESYFDLIIDTSEAVRGKKLIAPPYSTVVHCTNAGTLVTDIAKAIAQYKAD